MANDVNETLADRNKVYGKGSYADRAAMAQRIKDTMRDGLNWGSLTPSMKEGLEMVAHKIARIVSGNPNHADSWHDIAGYALLVEETLSAPAPVPPLAPVYTDPVKLKAEPVPTPVEPSRASLNLPPPPSINDDGGEQ